MPEVHHRVTGKALHVSDESVDFWLARGYRLPEPVAAPEQTKPAPKRRTK